VDEDELIARLASLPEREVPEDELESLATQSGVAVCGTWPDSTKPHRFDYEVLKGDELIQKSEPVGGFRIFKVPCKSHDDAIMTKNMFFGPPEQS
jgi:hypothetical protein